MSCAPEPVARIAGGAAVTGSGSAATTAPLVGRVAGVAVPAGPTGGKAGVSGAAPVSGLPTDSATATLRGGAHSRRSDSLPSSTKIPLGNRQAVGTAAVRRAAQ